MTEKTKTKALPKGEGLVWSVIGTLVSGPLVWGAIGGFVDRRLATEPRYLALGLIVGFVVRGYVVYIRYGKNDEVVKQNGGNPEQRSG